MGAARHTVAMFPGTFDPMTNGHLDLIHRAVRMFNELIVAVGTNPEKRALFSPTERREMIERVTAAEGLTVRVEQYDGLTVDFARDLGAAVIVRGIRNHADLNFEFQLALTNRAVADVETVFVMTNEQHGFTSSTLIKQIAASGRIEHLRRLLPPLVVERIQAKLACERHIIEDLATDAHKD
jgi:pantetheine-phosphate adenylyltransferase